MNIRLRKRHRYMWMVLGIALPLLCLEAIEGIPRNVIADIPRHSCPAGISNCITDHEQYKPDSVFTWHIFDNDSLVRINLQVKKPIKSAFTTVYLQHDDMGLNSQLVGQVNGMGEYSYDVARNDFEKARGIFIIDELKRIVFDSKSIEDLRP